jgi:putative restriction endonuclease
MPVNLSVLTLGEKYHRDFLSEIWGYQAPQAIRRGVITPRGANLIILFVTKEKQSSATQYKDFIQGTKLFWEGEEKHGSDQRIINTGNNNDEIYLFYRDVHHSPFIYYGRLYLTNYSIKIDKPSEFVFQIVFFTSGDDRTELIEIEEENKIKEMPIPDTEKEQLIKARRGQGKFRANLELVETKCRLTGVNFKPLLVASHIKPWKDSTNEEKLDGNNGLLLSPHVDKLFDKGYISFSDDGEVLCNNDEIKEIMKAWGLDITRPLGTFNNNQKIYLNYHRKFKFKT